MFFAESVTSCSAQRVNVWQRCKQTNNGSYHGNCQATLNIAVMICIVCNALETRMSSKGKKFIEAIELFRLVKNREGCRELRKAKGYPGRGRAVGAREGICLPGGMQGWGRVGAGCVVQWLI